MYATIFVYRKQKQNYNLLLGPAPWDESRIQVDNQPSDTQIRFLLTYKVATLNLKFD